MITAVVVVEAGGRPGAVRSGPARTAAAENDGLIGQYSPHVSTESLYILCDEDPVLLGLIPECIEALSK